MSLFESQQKLSELEGYIALNTRLEGIVPDEFMPLLSATHEYLTDRHGFCQKEAFWDGEALKKDAQIDGITAKRIQRISEDEGVGYDEAKRKVDKADKKDIFVKRLEMLEQIILNEARAESESDEEFSSAYLEIARMYRSTLSDLDEAIVIRERTMKMQERNLLMQERREKNEADNSLSLRLIGFDEKTADYIALNPEVFAYNILNSLKSRYES